MSSNDDFVLARAKIAILGLGLMGGSLALALRGKCAALYGIDPDTATLELALRQNIIDQAENYPDKLIRMADVLVLAAPVPVILSVLGELPQLMPEPCIVIDLGSTKRQITAKMDKLPERFEPVGGHPICGKERLSLENADRTLYYAAPFLLTPLARTTKRALAAVGQIITAIGAVAQVLDASDHDRILASTSHVPFLLSSALALATPQDVSPFVGPGFRSASRLAGTPSSMMLGVVLSNRENILAALERLQDELAIMISMIAENDSELLKNNLISAQSAYQELTRTK